jgi:hypothetical protein
MNLRTPQLVRCTKASKKVCATGRGRRAMGNRRLLGLSGGSSGRSPECFEKCRYVPIAGILLGDTEREGAKPFSGGDERMAYTTAALLDRILMACR